MTTPAYSHTYTYSRPGVGDVIALDGGGHPYTIFASSPAGWTANYWYATDPLASVRDVAAWTALTPYGPIPGTARKIAVNVITASRTPESARLEVKVSSNAYKSATGLRYTDSGSHATSFNSDLPLLPPAPENLVHWFEFDALGTMWQDEARTIPALIANDPIFIMDNRGYDGTGVTAIIPSQRPVLDSTTHPSLTAAFNNTNVLVGNGTVVGDMDKGLKRPWAYAVAFSEDANDSDGAWVYMWDNTFRIAVTVLSTTDVIESPSQWATTDPTTITADLMNGVQTNAGPDNEIDTQFSIVAAPTVTTGVDFAIGDKKKFFIGSFSPSAPPTASLSGNIGHVLQWDRELTAAERLAYEAYATTKLGVVWV